MNQQFQTLQKSQAIIFGFCKPDKILQPFYTTPTEQGTGLGLSLSHDIVKAYGGKFEVETKEGNGSVFVIRLPNGA